MAEHDESKAESMMEKIAEKVYESKSDSIMDKIAEKMHRHDSSSDSDDEKSFSSETKEKIFRLFGREKPVHKVLGGGKPADVFLWRDKKLSGGALGVATVIWALFEVVEYHLLTLICHGLILGLAILFLWSNATAFIHKSPPQFPEVTIPEKPILELFSVLRSEINRALFVAREIASGKNLKQFLGVIAGLWVLSVVGSWFNFLTLLYIVFVLLHTVPVLYEKHEDKVDPIAEKAFVELKKQYAVFDMKVLSKIPKGPLKDKKSA